MRLTGEQETAIEHGLRCYQGTEPVRTLTTRRSLASSATTRSLRRSFIVCRIWVFRLNGKLFAAGAKRIAEYGQNCSRRVRKAHNRPFPSCLASSLFSPSFICFLSRSPCRHLTFCLRQMHSRALKITDARPRYLARTYLL